MNLTVEVLIFLAGTFGYGLRGWLGKFMVMMFFRLIKKLVGWSPDDAQVYREQREASRQSGKLRAR